MKWLESPNADEHVLCDERGRQTGYRVRRDPVSGIYRGFCGEKCIAHQLSIYKAKAICQREYSKRESAA